MFSDDHSLKDEKRISVKLKRNKPGNVQCALHNFIIVGGGGGSVPAQPLYRTQKESGEVHIQFCFPLNGHGVERGLMANI